jgi:hypothetical protein
VDVLTALAEVLQLSGRPGEAARSAEDALRLAREKRYEPGALAAQAITQRAGQPLDGRPD